MSTTALEPLDPTLTAGSNFWIEFTPAITGPVSTFASIVRNEVEPPETQVPSVPVTNGPKVMSMDTTSYTGADTKSYRVHRDHEDLHATTHTALIAVGSVGATIIIFFALWLGWKCFQMQSGNGSETSTLSSPRKLMQLMTSFVPCVPILKKRSANPSVSDVVKPYDDGFWGSKLPPSADGGVENSGANTVPTGIASTQEVKESNAVRLHLSPQNQPGSSNHPRLSNIPGQRMSEISSLSSGFGDGDIIVPTENNFIIAAERLMVPAPAAQRSSVGGASQ
ncbi:hypothetical protein RJ55_07614 [Drechmeria coniospora]|nr:hypothetical protein RJ55_07614 [Drechmeria coniospora]